jgi:D-amino-acid dehydrogenase
MEVLGPLGHESRALFDELVEGEALDCEFRPEGYYEIYRSEAGFEGAQAEIPLQQAHGYQTRTVTGSAIREIEPALKEGTVGGLYFPEAATLDPLKLLLELADRAKRKGAEIRTGADVVSIVRDGSRVGGVVLSGGERIEASCVILATGAYSQELARSGGIRTSIQPAKGYHRDLADAKQSGPPLGNTCMLGERFVFCTPMGGGLRLAGTLELSGLNHDILEPRLKNLDESAGRYLDGLDGLESRDDWVGLRPCTPDGLPVIGPSPGLEGLWVSNGHAMLGLTLGPVTGQLLADWILDGKRPGILAALRPDRF